MSKVVVVSDLEGRVIGLARQAVGKGIAMTAKPRDGQAVYELDLPAEFDKHELAALHDSVKIDRAGGAPKLARR